MNTREHERGPTHPTSPKTYLSHLEDLRSILSHLPSPSRTPLEQEDTNDTILLKKKIEDALAAAHANPADGRWGMITRLLSMPSTRGRYRWIGLRKEGDIEDDIRMDSRLFEFSQMDPQRVDSHPESIKPQEEELLSPSPMPPIGLTSEAEWEAWERAERKREEEERVMMKIERWRRVLVQAASPDVEEDTDMSRASSRPEPSSSYPVPVHVPSQEEEVIQEVNAAQDNSSLTKVNENSPLKPSISKEPTLLVTNDTSSSAVPKVQGSLTLTSSADLLANRAPLGFAVVKRGSKNTVGNGKPKATVSKDTIIVDDSLKEKDDTSQASSKGKAREASIPVQRSGSKPPSKGRPQSKPSSRAQSQPPSKSSPPAPMITDLSEMSFLPPSFPSSELITSTPKPKSAAQEEEHVTRTEGDAEREMEKGKGKQKPEVIPVTCPEPGPSADSSLLAGSKSPQLASSNPFAHASPPPPLPAFPSSLPPISSPIEPVHPTSSGEIEDPSSSIMPSSPIQRRAARLASAKPPSRGKRPREASPSPAPAKRSRVERVEPVTPQQEKGKKASPLPTLTELLASSRKGGRVKRKSSRRELVRTPSASAGRMDAEEDQEKIVPVAPTSPKTKKMMGVSDLAKRFKSTAATTGAKPESKGKFKPAVVESQNMGKGKFKPTSSSTTTADRAKPTSKSKFKPALAAPLSPPSPAQEAQSEAIESSPEAASSPEREPISPITPKHPSINPTSKAKSKSIFPTPSSPPAPAGVLMHPNDIFVGMEDSYIPLSLSSSSDPFSIDERDPYALSGVDYDTSSPTKSLSSLAESDDEEDEGESSFKGYKGIESIELSQDFHPPFASTQNGSAGQGGKFGWMGYSSQVDVDHQVNEVDKLLERDVDYDGWLRDPSLDPEEV